MIESISIWCSIISLPVGVLGVILTIYFWHYTWKRIKALRKIKRLSLSEEYSFTTFNNEVMQLLQDDPELRNPFKLTSPNLQESLKAALFNMIKSQYEQVK